MGDAKKEGNDGVSPFDSFSAYDVFKQPKVESDDPPRESAKPKFQPKVKPRPQAKSKAQAPSASAKSQVKKESSAGPSKIEIEPAEPPAPPKQVLDAEVGDIVMKDAAEEVTEVKHMDVDVKLEAEIKEEEVEIKDEPMSPVFTQPGEDRVVREIDVYFTPCIDPDSKVYLLQYPLRPYWRPYGLEERCQEVRVKPKQSRLEVDLVIDNDGENYDDSVKEHLKITKQTLTSSRTPLSAGYALGILRQNKLHLNPVHAAVQLRPLMSYVEKGEESTKKNRKGTGYDEEMADADEENEEEPPEAKPKMVPLQVELKKETERQEQMRLQSHAYLKKLDEAEPWIALEPHGIDSPVTDEFRQKMVAVEDFQIPFSMNMHDYVNTLVPGRASTGSNEATFKEDNGNEGFSRSFLDTLPLEERFGMLLSKGRVQVLQFEHLMRLAPTGSTEEEVLEVLQQFAYLVQGCWVAASSLRYNGDICKVRDYILLLFNKNRLVRHEQLEELKLSKETIREVLVSLAVQRPAAGGWEFQEATDRSFMKNHQNIVKEQSQRWSENEEGIKKAAFSVKIVTKDNMKSTESSSQHSNTFATDSRKGSVTTDMNGTAQGVKPAQVIDGGQVAGTGAENKNITGRTMPEETRVALPGVLREVLTNRLCNLQEICQSLRNLAKGKLSAKNINPKAVAAAVAAAKGASAPLPELTAVINQVASNINGVYFLTSLGNPTLDPFRDVVIKLLRTKGPGTALRKVDITEACKIALGREVPQAVYLKVMKELCNARGNGWVLKTGDGRPE